MENPGISRFRSYHLSPWKHYCAREGAAKVEQRPHLPCKSPFLYSHGISQRSPGHHLGCCWLWGNFFCPPSYSDMRLDYQRSAVFMDARDVLVVQPLPDDAIEVCWHETREKLKNWWINRKQCEVLIVTGFIARSVEDDLPVTLKEMEAIFPRLFFLFFQKLNP